MDGATPAGTVPLPENLKAHVYIPPNLLREFEGSHEPIARIVQSFIENVGVPTVIRWRHAVTALGWKLKNQSKTTPTPSQLPLIPDPTLPTSAHYIFPGRPYGSFPTVSPVSSLPSLSFLGQPEAQDMDSLRHNLRVSQSRVTELEAVVDRLREHVDTALVSQKIRVHHAAPSPTRYKFPRPQLSMPLHRLNSSAPKPTLPSQQAIRTTNSATSGNLSPHGVHGPSTLNLYQQAASSPTPDVATRIRPFGAFCHDFILTQGMDVSLHQKIRHLHEHLPSKEWQLEMMNWFGDEDEETACLLAGSLYIDMCADALTLEREG
jgi:hypothetical protein